MRNLFVGFLAVTLAAGQMRAQSGPTQLLPQSCPLQGCYVGEPYVVHVSSSADVRLENGVLHYVTGQVLQNNGGDNAEVIWTLPLPPSAAFRNLTMSINGEMIAGEIYPRARARQIYNAIVATRKDPALVEWVSRDLLSTSIYPIFPGETKYVDMRIEAVAKESDNRIRIDYFAGSNSSRNFASDYAPVTMTFTYPDSAHYGTPYSNTHVISSPTVTRGMKTVTVSGKTREATIFLPVSRLATGSISVLPHAVAGEDGYALVTIVAPTRWQPDNAIYALTELRLDAGRVELRDIDPAILKKMYPGESRTFAIRYRGSGTTDVSVNANVAGSTVAWRTRVHFPIEDRRNSFAARFWATEITGTLDLSRRCDRATVDVDSTIARIGTHHSIPTPMTSYMVLEPGIIIGADGQVKNAAEFRAQRPTISAAAMQSAMRNAATQAVGPKMSITGIVTDAYTGTPLSLASVRIAGSSLGVATSTDGRYTIANVPVGFHTLEVRRVGYVPSLTGDVHADSGATAVRDFSLTVQALILSGVVTTGVADPASGTRVPFSITAIGTERSAGVPVNDAVEAPASALQSTCTSR